MYHTRRLGHVVSKLVNDYADEDQHPRDVCRDGSGGDVHQPARAVAEMYIGVFRIRACSVPLRKLARKRRRTGAYICVHVSTSDCVEAVRDEKKVMKLNVALA